MSIHCFTSITFSYLNRARVLGQTVKKHHPDWTLWLCVTDREPPGFSLDVDDEPFDEVLYSADLGIPDFESWLFRHNIVEACTAVKGPMLRRLLETGAEQVFYLDPDTAVCNSLQPMVEMLSEASILLTPHQLMPDHEHQAIVDNEICSLGHGIYNLGFIAVSNSEPSWSFSQWWKDRCLEYCYDEREKGIFVDQKWCDLVPAFFDGVTIVRDPGYNVASWNLSNRTLAMTADGEMVVNKSHLLRFFHFTKLGPIGDTMTRRYAGDNMEVYELWAWYKRKVTEFTDQRIPEGWWHYGTFSSGEPIPDRARAIYRSRTDLQSAFPDPFETSGYSEWFRHQGPREYPDLLRGAD